MKKQTKKLIASAIGTVILAAISFGLLLAAIPLGKIAEDVETNGGIIFRQDKVRDVSYSDGAETEGVTEIVIEAAGYEAEAVVRESADGMITFAASGKIMASSDPGIEFKTERKGGTLKFKAIRKKFVWPMFNIFIGKITVEIPAEYSGALTLKMTSGSAGVNLPNKLSAFNVQITSGKIDAEVDADAVSLKLTSGSIVYAGDYKTLTAEMTSGKAVIRTASRPEKIDVKITSGSLELFLCEPASFKLNYNITSGSVKCVFDGRTYKGSSSVTYGDGAAEINVRVTSGRVEIKRAG